jgi:UDP-N-acetylmuramate dehydrogenase
VQFQLRIGEMTTPITYAELAKKLNIAVGEKAPVVATRDAVLELRSSKGMVLNAADPDSVSAGSFFTNPIVSADVAATLPDTAPKWPTEDGRVKLSAAWLIENSGICKGDEVKGAKVSSKHVLALTNKGDATAADIAALAYKIRKSVNEKYGITLEPEVNFVGITL